MSKQFSIEENVLRDVPAAHLTERPEADRDIDMSLLEDSLRLTPWQRLIENDRALALVRMLEQAGTRDHGTA